VSKRPWQDDLFLFSSKRNQGKEGSNEMRIKNWEKFQHFKNRRPPWIKLYRDLLEDLNWFKLPGEDAKMLVMLWLIASEEDGELLGVDELAFRLRKSKDDVISCVSRLNHWIIQDDINVISSEYQDVTPEKERETESEIESETETKAEDVVMSPEIPDPYFQEIKAQPHEVAAICVLATKKYKNTQFQNQIQPYAINLLSQLPFETVKKAVENTSKMFEMHGRAHDKRPNFEKQFDSAQSVQEQAEREPVAPVSDSEKTEERPF
jgi:hypothetical protein